MYATLTEKDRRKHLLCKNSNQQLEIYCYEENERSFSVCLTQDEQLITYGTYAIRGVAKEMGYWLAGQLFRKDQVTKEEFYDTSLEKGHHKWHV